MKWIYIIEHKLIAAFILGCILFLVLYNNIGENNKMIKLGESFNTMYEDRLMAENYLFKLSEMIHKGLLFMPKDINAESIDQYTKDFDETRKAINPMIALYKTTVLTDKESFLFENLQNIVVQLEASFSVLNNENSSYEDRYNHINNIESNLKKSLILLSSMAEIQVVVGRELREQSMASIKSSVLSSNFEIGLLVVLSLIIQALIFASKTVQTKFAKPIYYN